MAVRHHSADPWKRDRTLHDLPADEVISALQKEIRRRNSIEVAQEQQPGFAVLGGAHDHVRAARIFTGKLGV